MATLRRLLKIRKQQPSPSFGRIYLKLQMWTGSRPREISPLRSETGLMITIPCATSSRCLGSRCSIASWWMGRRGRVGRGSRSNDFWERGQLGDMARPVASIVWVWTNRWGDAGCSNQGLELLGSNSMHPLLPPPFNLWGQLGSSSG